MTKPLALLFCLLLMSTVIQARITDFVFDHGKVYGADDSLIFTYSSDYDSAWIDLYVDAAAPANLDTAADKLLYPLLQMDNFTDEVEDKSKMILPDMDPAAGKYRFAPGTPGLPAGLYWLRVYDADTVIADSFRVAAIANPYRTISGTVTTPAGMDKSYIQVDADYGNRYRVSAYTDDNGDYTIALDSEAVVADSGSFRVRANLMDEGYMLQPSETQVNVEDGNASGIDFAVVEITSGVNGVLTSDGVPLPNIGIGLRDSAQDRDVAWTQTNNDGEYSLGAGAGVYRIHLSREDLTPGYMSPGGERVLVNDGEFATVDISVPKADTSIFGRITKDGGAPGDSFRIRLQSKTLNLESEAVADINGYFTLPASTLDTAYWANVDTWDDRYGSVPDGYQFENSRNNVDVVLGDSALFNMIPKPAGAITGSITNTSIRYPVVTRVSMSLWRADTTAPWLYFNQESVGPYLFDGIPNGRYSVSVMLAVGNGPEDWKLQKNLKNSSGSDSVIEIADNTVTVDFDFTDADTMAPIIPQNASIEGVVLYTGTLPLVMARVMLVDETNGFSIRNVSVDSSGHFKIFDVPMGMFRVQAIIDTNFDQMAEATGVADSLFVVGGPEEINGVQIRVNDKPTGTGAISGTIRYNGPWPQNGSLHVFALPIDSAMIGNLPPLQRLFPFAFPIESSGPGDYSINNLPAGYYIVVASADSSQDSGGRQSFAFATYAIQGEDGPEALPVLVGTEMVTGIDFEISAETPKGNNVIQGVASYSGLYPDSAIVVLLLDRKEGKVVRGVRPDINMSFTFVDVPAGKYRIMAMLDDNGDESAEAFGELDSILSVGNGDTLRGLLVTLADKPVGTGSVSGTLSSDKPLPPNTIITVYAIPVDTTLPDSEMVKGEAAGINAYSVQLTELGDYTISEMPDLSYVLVAVAETKDTAAGDTGNGDKGNEFGVGIYGIKTANSGPNTWDFNVVTISGGEAVTGINVEILADTNPPVIAEEPEIPLPATFVLGDGKPNPFNPVVNISYAVPVKAAVSLLIYDITGKMIRTLVSGVQEPGFKSAVWDAKNSQGKSMASGIYICRMQSGKYTANRKLILMK